MLRARSKKGGPNAQFGSPHMAKHDALGIPHVLYPTCMQLNSWDRSLQDILFVHTKEPCLSSVKPQPRPDRPVDTTYSRSDKDNE